MTFGRSCVRRWSYGVRPVLALNMFVERRVLLTSRGQVSGLGRRRFLDLALLIVL